MQVEKLVDRLLLSIICVGIVNAEEWSVAQMDREDLDELVQDAGKLLEAVNRFVEDERNI